MAPKQGDWGGRNLGGSVDSLVNDAAAFVFRRVEDVTDADWQRVLGVNVMGIAYCVKHALP